MLNVQDIKIRTLHDSFYWDLMWGMLEIDLFSIEKTVQKYWKHVKIKFPARGLKLYKIVKIIRTALLKKSCFDNHQEFDLNLLYKISFYKNNCENWNMIKNRIIKMQLQL